MKKNFFFGLAFAALCNPQNEMFFLTKTKCINLENEMFIK